VPCLLLLLLLLLQDHLNDIMSNLCAIITAILAGVVANGWWVDPVGAIAISLYIVARWLAIAKQQVRSRVHVAFCCGLNMPVLNLPPTGPYDKGFLVMRTLIKLWLGLG
jgi:hypothetical protein